MGRTALGGGVEYIRAQTSITATLILVGKQSRDLTWVSFESTKGEINYPGS